MRYLAVGLVLVVTAAPVLGQSAPQASSKAIACMTAAVAAAVSLHFDTDTADAFFDRVCKAEQAAYRAALITEADPSLSRAHNKKVADAVVGFGPFYAKQRFREITGKAN